jgi:hypothetical protein
MLKKECLIESDGDPLELAGFITRHRLSLVFEDWCVLSDLLAWLRYRDAFLVSMRQSEPVFGRSEAMLVVEGIRARALSEWLRAALEDQRVLSARLEHLLTSIDTSDSATHSAEFN